MLKITQTPQNIYIVTRSTNVITINIANITQFLRVVTDLQPSTAPLLPSMHDKEITVQHKQQNYRNILTNRRIYNNALVVQVIQKS